MHSQTVLTSVAIKLKRSWKNLQSSVLLNSCVGAFVGVLGLSLDELNNTETFVLGIQRGWNASEYVTTGNAH